MVFNDRNKLTEDILMAMVPKMALIAYQGNQNSGYYLEARRIDENGEMGAGMAVPYSFLKDITKEFIDTETFLPHGEMPANIIYCDLRSGSEKIVWHEPPQKRAMHFRKNLGIKSGDYFVPGVVYVAKKHSLDVYAFKDETPTMNTELFKGPFFNTTDGSVCLGSAKINLPHNPTFKQVQEYWEARFWKTEFTHLGGSANPTKDNLVVVTKQAAKKPFDTEQLKPMNIKIKNLIA